MDSHSVEAIDQRINIGGGGTQFEHGRSRMTIDPRILTMPARRTSGFHQPGRHCLHQARSAVRCSASRMNGSTASFQEPLVGRTSAPCVPSFLLMDDSK